MKYLKLFEEFKDSSSARADSILKQIEKVVRYNLQYGALKKKGFVYGHSEIYDDKGPYDWLKFELYTENEKTEYRYNVIFMMDEEFLGVDAVEGDEKVHVEISKYRLPEFKKIVSIKNNYPLKDVFADEFLANELENADKKVLKVPKDEAEYQDNLKNQIDQAEDLVAEEEPIEAPSEEGTEVEQPEEAQS